MCSLTVFTFPAGQNLPPPPRTFLVFLNVFLTENFMLFVKLYTLYLNITLDKKHLSKILTD